MTRPILLALVLLAAPWLAAPPARAQGTAPDSLLDYRLASPPSTFEWGCFAPCMCPILVQSPLAGTFTLRRHPDPDPAGLYAEYDVLDVQWKADNGTRVVTITGGGTYRWGGEFALVDQLTLDLSIDGGPPQRFDSGLRPVGATFPGIDTRISLHNEFCRDSVLILEAQATGVTAVAEGAGRPLLTIAPNPFGAATRVAFTLPRAGWAQLTVFDVAGRRVRVLAAREWLDRGPHERTWDGRTDTGAAAPPGIYRVRLDLPDGPLIRALAKVH
jgi:hypothetical protein